MVFRRKATLCFEYARLRSGDDLGRSPGAITALPTRPAAVDQCNSNNSSGRSIYVACFSTAGGRYSSLRASVP